MIPGLISLSLSLSTAQADLSIQKTADAVTNPSITAPTSGKHIVTYDISSRGTIYGDLVEFRKIVTETLNDARGWNRANVSFQPVSTGAQMHIILASPASVKAASPTGCSEQLSCRVGSLVLINDDRWRLGSDSYNDLGISIQNYRQMVINHEVGHFLGHGHIEACTTSSGLAPIMLQQSTGLRGCSPYAWPLPSELWVSL